mmetsp:Transcript_19958/g.46758  ORF Transcript_19958/g.46758 Transcript_19958/m.46758 type:complete len:231 (-) Transcript_19958:999-1691(-)
MEVWKRPFCALRSSPACLRLTSMSAMSLVRSAISAVSVWISLLRARCFSARSSLRFSPSLMESSVRSISFVQNSHLVYSSFCCFCSSASILSMISLTLEKASRPMCTANEESAQLFWCCAATVIRRTARSMARSRRAEEALTCTKLMVLAYKSRASSSVRIFRVSVNARISSVRTATRCLYSSSSSLQFFSKVARKAWSAASASSMASFSSLALAALSRRSANAASFCAF